MNSLRARWNKLAVFGDEIDMTREEWDDIGAAVLEVECEARKTLDEEEESR